MSLPVPYYQDSAVTIYHGDCREILPHLPKVDLVLTDPPYGIGLSSGAGKYGCLKWSGAKDLKWDTKIPDNEVFEMLLSKSDVHIIWGGNFFPLPLSPCYLVWDKGAGFKNRSFSECEMAWSSMDRAPKIFAWDPLARGDYKGKQHPTQKPEPLIRWCINLADNPQTILDPFMGSGTTLRAAKDLGRKAIGIELEEKYCEIAARRMAQEVLL